MNRKQRDANRRTTREVQAALAARKRGLLPWQERVMTLADLTDGARKVVFCMNPEQDPPVLVEGESDLTKVLGHVWVSSSYWTQAPDMEVTTIAAENDVVSFRHIDAQAKETT